MADKKTELPPFDLDKAVKQDLEASIAFLNMVRSEPDILKAVTELIRKKTEKYEADFQKVNADK